MYKINHTTTNELSRVQEKITKELASEKIIQDIYEYIFQSKGKKTRALIALLASQSKKLKPLKRIELASIIELLHTATLVHDDVVDQSKLRRGEKSVNQVWNNSYSVLMGDFIYSKAFMLMMKLDRPAILKELAGATNDIARGEIIQLNLFENYLHLDLDGLLKVSYLKTGRLFEAAAKTGAMLADSSKADVKSFGLLGKTLGIAFQIQDDILDIEGDAVLAGKRLQKDVSAGKATFVSLLGIENAKLRAKELIEEAIDALSDYGVKAEPMRQVAKFIIERKM